MKDLNAIEIKLISGGDAKCMENSEISFEENDSNFYKGTFYVGAVIGKGVYATIKSIKAAIITTKVGIVNFANGFYSVFCGTNKAVPVVDKKDLNL